MRHFSLTRSYWSKATAISKEAQASGDLRSIWQRVKQIRRSVANSEATPNDLERAIAEFFAWETRHLRLEVLRNTTDKKLIAAKQTLLSKLRTTGVFVLEKGRLKRIIPTPSRVLISRQERTSFAGKSHQKTLYWHCVTTYLTTARFARNLSFCVNVFVKSIV